MSSLTFYVIPAPSSGLEVPDVLNKDFNTWWDAHDAMMDYCKEAGLSPSEFWIEESEE